MYDQQLARRLREAVVAAGAKDVVRVFASVEMAVGKGEDIDAMLASVRRNQPDLFGKPKRKFTDDKPSRESQARKSKTTKRARWDDDE